MGGGKYLLLMLAMAAIIVSVSSGHRRRDRDSNEDSSDDRDDDSDDDTDDDSDDDMDDDSDEDRDDNNCPGGNENHVWDNCVEAVRTLTRLSVHPCNGSEDHRTNNRCYKIIVYSVTIQVCYTVCCEGWVKDEFGRCTVPVTPDILCENGGTPDHDGAYCICSNDFTGRQCETALCSPRCDNGGECIAENGYTSCVCTEGFTGAQCKEPVCPETCQNGGTCVSQGYCSSCECSPGFSGRACEHKVRPGTCPSIRDMGDLSSTNTRCAFDNDCSTGDKCCLSHYGEFCVTPGTPTCLYDGNHYTQGQEVSKSACENCTCIRPSILHQSDDEFTCYTIDCPPISCPDYTYRADKCCPVCAGTVPREPQISDCPTKTVEVAVQSDKNMISVTERFKTIQAHDHNMDVLKVTFSHGSLRSCACNYTELDFHHITAVSEPDTYGRMAYCSFTVKVIDVHSPRFSHCPSMISAFTDQKIIWQAPAASDNVGVREVNLRSKYANNTMFPEGKHFVEYHAKDFHENVAVCRIPVSVYTKGTTDPSLPIGMRRTSTIESKHYLYIGVGAGAVVLLILLLVAIMYCRHLRTPSSPQEPPTTEKMSGTFNNGLYAKGMYPPPYDNIAFKGDKSGQPSYKPGSPPPAYRASITKAEYESIAVPSVTDGIDNQMYMDESLYHSLQAHSTLSDKGREAEKSPPPSYRGAPSSPSHYEELDIQ